MRNYSITNFLCDQTYGGVYCFSNLGVLNDTMKSHSMLTLEKHYGTDRPYVTEVEPSNESFPAYMFIAWLDGNVEMSGDLDYDGHYLFVIGFTDNPRNCVSDIYRMGDKYFEAKAQGYEI